MVFNEILNNTTVRKAFLHTLSFFLLCLAFEHRSILINKFSKPISNLVKNVFIVFFTKVTHILSNIRIYFKDKKFFLIIIVINIVFETLFFCTFLSTGHFLWSLAIGWPMFSITGLFAFYAKEFLDWCKHVHPVLEKIVSIPFALLGYLSPAILFCLGTFFATLYFEPEIKLYEVVIHIGFILLLLCFIIYYCIELVDVVNQEYILAQKIKLFLFCIIHIIQLFTNIYISLLIFDHSALAGVTTDSPLLLCFDLTFFSAMTLLNGGCSILPMSVWAKSIVLIQSFVFTVFISIIIFGIIANDSSKEVKTSKDTQGQ